MKKYAYRIAALGGGLMAIVHGGRRWFRSSLSK